MGLPVLLDVRPGRSELWGCALLTGVMHKFLKFVLTCANVLSRTDAVTAPTRLGRSSTTEFVYKDVVIHKRSVEAFSTRCSC